MDPTYPLYPILVFLGFIMCLIPLPWHLQAWNTGTCLYMIWTAVACLTGFVNSVVWHNNTINWAPVWCDISTRVTIGASIGIPAASLCINRRLYKIAAIQNVTLTRRERNRAILVDLAIALGFPILIIVLSYIVQGHRANIYEDYGCYPALFDTPPTYVLVWMWPVVIGLASMIYCVLTLRAFVVRRAQMNEFLATNKSITFSRYFRLMALAGTELCLTVPLASFGIWLDASEAIVSPWRGWADAHFDFHRIDQVPAILYRSNHLFVISLELSRWALVLCAFIFFGYFGFADEARKNYRLAFWSVSSRLGFKPKQTANGTSLMGSATASWRNGGSKNGNTSTLPVFVTTEKLTSGANGTMSSKRDSFLSSIGDLSTSFAIDSISGPLDEKDSSIAKPNNATNGNTLPTLHIDSSSKSFLSSSGSSQYSPDVESPNDEFSTLPHLPVHGSAIPPVPIPMPMPPPVFQFSSPRHDADVPAPVRPPRPASLDMV